MIYLNTIRTNLTHYFDFSEPLTRQQKTVYGIASAVFAAICAYSIYRLYRACCFKKEAEPKEQKTKAVAEQILKEKVKETPKEDIKAAPAIEPIDDSLTLIKELNISDWTRDEIGDMIYIIPQWFKRHMSFKQGPEDDPKYLEDIMDKKLKASHAEITFDTSLSECRKILNAELQRFIDFMSARDYRKLIGVLRVLTTSTNPKENLITTCIIQKAWERIVEEGRNNRGYYFVLETPHDNAFSKDSYAILGKVLEKMDRKDPKYDETFNIFENRNWKIVQSPRACMMNEEFNVILLEK